MANIVLRWYEKGQFYVEPANTAIWKETSYSDDSCEAGCEGHIPDECIICRKSILDWSFLLCMDTSEALHFTCATFIND